jgi:hypothetical protein
VLGRVGTIVSLLRRGRVDDLGRTLRMRWHSTHEAYGMRRDLAEPFETPPAKIPVTVRQVTDADVAAILGSRAGSEHERIELIERQGLLAQRRERCFVAVDASGAPTFVQWLFLPEDNAFVQSHFKGVFLPLAPGEALLENAYTFERYRGLAIMAHAMSRICEEARALGCRWGVTHVGCKNVPSLKGCARAGFCVATRHDHRWRAFRMTLGSSPLDAATREAVQRRILGPAVRAG